MAKTIGEVLQINAPLAYLNIYHKKITMYFEKSAIDNAHNVRVYKAILNLVD